MFWFRLSINIMKKNNKDLALVIGDLDSEYTHYKTIKVNDKEKDKEIHAIKRSHVDKNRFYQSVTYCLESLSERDKGKIQKEIRVYTQIQCANLVKLKGYNIANGSETQITFLSEYRKKSLLDFFSEQAVILKERSLEFMGKLAHTLHSLHKIGISHNRISLETIFIKNDTILLGLPFFRSIEKLQRKSIPKIFEESANNIYLASELLEGYCLSQKSDVWALGIVFLQLTSGTLLQAEPKKEILKQNIAKHMSKVPNSGIRDLLYLMLTEKKDERITVEDVVNHLMMCVQLPKDSEFKTQLSLSLFPILIPSEDNCSKFLAKIYCEEHSIKFCSNQNQLFVSGALINSNNQSLAVLSVQYSQSLPNPITFALSTSNLTDQIKKYLPDIGSFWQAFKQNLLNLKLSQQGSLVVQFIQSRLKQCVKSYNLPQKLQRLKRCLVTVENDRGQSYDGLLVGFELVLTSARAVSNSQSNYAAGHLTIDCKEQHGIKAKKCKSFSYYSPKNLMVSNHPNLNDYSLLELETNIARRRYITMVSDYKIAETKQKLKQFGDKVKFHYQIGDYKIILPNQINFLVDHKFALKVPVEQARRGCPLLVVFSHNQCYCIGMLQSADNGYLFDQDFYWNVWSWVQSNLNLNGWNSHLATTRMLQWKKVQLQLFQPPYFNPLLLKVQNEKESDYFLKGWPPMDESLLRQINSLVLEQTIQKKNYNYEKCLSISDSLIDLYKRVYGEESQSIALELYDRTQLLQQCGRNAFQVIKNLQFFIKTEQPFKRNIIIYAISQRNLGNLYYNNSQTASNFQKAIRFLHSCQKIADKLDSWQLRAHLFSDLALLYFSLDKLQLSRFYCHKATQYSKNFGLKHTHLFKSLIWVNRKLFDYKAAVEILKRAYYLRNNNQTNSQEIKTLLTQEWQAFYQQMLTNDNISIEAIDFFLEVTSQFERNITQEVTAVLIQRKRILAQSQRH